MRFICGCIAVVFVIISLVMSIIHESGKDCCIIHWLLGFFAALVFAGLTVLGTR